MPRRSSLKRERADSHAHARHSGRKKVRRFPINSCYIYTRVSTAVQVDGYSLDAQLKALRDYAEYRSLRIAGEYCDAGKSGKSISGRPAFQKMMDDVMSQKDNVSYVLVFKLSRFGRNAADVLGSIQRLEDYGVSLVSVNEAIDSSTSSGKLTLSILSAVAEMERTNIASQFMAGRIQSIRDGRWTGGPIPYGYRNTDGGLVVDPSKAEIVKEVFRLYAQNGATATSVADDLNRSTFVRFDSKGKERRFTYEFVSKMLDNPVYCGRLLFMRRTNRKDHDGKTLKCNPEDVIVAEGKHDAIISEEEWDRIQEKRKCVSLRYRGYAVTSHPHVLSGLARCPLCGKGLVGNTYKSKLRDGSGRFGKSISYYICRYNVKQNGRSCGFDRKLTEDILDGLVLEALAGLRFSVGFNTLLKKAFGVDNDIGGKEKDLVRLQKELRKAESMKDRIGSQLDALDPCATGYDSKYDRLSSELDKTYDRIELLETSIGEAKRFLDSTKKSRESFGNVLVFLEHLRPLIGKMTQEERKELCASMIERVEVFPEERTDGKIIRSISFRFPLAFNGTDMKREVEAGDSVRFTMDFSDVDICIPERSGIEIRTMDDGSRRVIVRKPTYPAIKRYVKERFGTNVSSLYIAQVKRKYGLEVGESYNKPKNPDARVPRCTEEKERMILEALKSFGLVDQNMGYKEEKIL